MSKTTFGFIHTGCSGNHPYHNGEPSPEICPDCETYGGVAFEFGCTSNPTYRVENPDGSTGFFAEIPACAIKEFYAFVRACQRAAPGEVHAAWTEKDEHAWWLSHL